MFTVRSKSFWNKGSLQEERNICTKNPTMALGGESKIEKQKPKHKENSSSHQIYYQNLRLVCIVLIRSVQIFLFDYRVIMNIEMYSASVQIYMCADQESLAGVVYLRGYFLKVCGIFFRVCFLFCFVFSRKNGRNCVDVDLKPHALLILHTKNKDKNFLLDKTIP